jgi:hypothetical protein
VSKIGYKYIHISNLGHLMVSIYPGIGGPMAAGFTFACINRKQSSNASSLLAPMTHLSGHVTLLPAPLSNCLSFSINPFKARSGHNLFPQRLIYPTCIQAQRMVKASNCLKISNHIARHSTINTGRIRSNQVTQSLTISQWVRWLIGLMVYSDDVFITAIGCTLCKS